MNTHAPQQDIAELVAQLEAGIAAPVAMDLRSALLDGDQRRAIRILREECFGPEAAEALYQHLRKIYAGGPTTLVEIDKSDLARVVAEAAKSGEPADFLVRRGREIVQSNPHFIHGETLFYGHRMEQISLAQVDQLWRIVIAPT